MVCDRRQTVKQSFGSEEIAFTKQSLLVPEEIALRKQSSSSGRNCYETVFRFGNAPGDKSQFAALGTVPQGKVKMNSVPTFSVLMTLMVWPWAEMISLTIERPGRFLSGVPRDSSLL